MQISAANPSHRNAVILGKGQYEDERKGSMSTGGPRPEFIVIASLLNSEIISYMSAGARRKRWFRALFRRRPALGSALDFALRARRFDSCYVTGEDIGLPLAIALMLRFWRGRMICVVHNITPKKATLFRLIGHRCFAAFVVVSRKQQAALINECGIPADKIVFNGNWVDTTYFQPDPKLRDGIKTTVMACGSENRDYLTLVRAAKSVSADFMIFAHGFFKRSGGPITEDPGNVHRMPRVSYDALRDNYQTADIVAVPLNDVSYAAGVTGLVEAMACGKPVVVTRTSGIVEYLEAVDMNFQVSPASPGDMSRALNFAISEGAEKRRIVGERNRAWVVENCSLEVYAKKVSALLNPSLRSS